MLFQRLESALYSAKRLGRNHSQRFRPALDKQDNPQLALVSDLRAALISGDQLELHYQTQHHPGSGELMGMEALLRWRHPQDGMVSPGEFIPLAERHGLMAELGSWVIEKACAQQAHWQNSGMPKVTVWINISALQLFQGDLETQLATCLERYQLKPSQIGLELTESVILDDPDQALATLHAIRETGVRLALDDFGTGFSSLSNLQHLPISLVKIDKSFVQELGQSADAEHIIRAIISLAHSLQISVVAEGVETEGQLEFLRQQHCDEIQGYYYARPMPWNDLVKFMNRQNQSACLQK